MKNSSFYFIINCFLTLTLTLSCNTKNSKKRILYKIDISAQDTIQKRMQTLKKMYPKKDLTFYFFYSNGKNGNHHFNLQHYYKNEFINKQHPYKYGLERTNRFLNINKEFFPLIFRSDNSLTKSNDILLSRVGGGNIFVLDYDGKFLKFWRTM